MTISALTYCSENIVSDKGVFAKNLQIEGQAKIKSTGINNIELQGLIKLTGVTNLNGEVLFPLLYTNALQSITALPYNDFFLFR